MTNTDSNTIFQPLPTDRRFIDLTGRRYGRLVVLGFAGTVRQHKYWHCLCDCGQRCVSGGGNLNNGHTKSCGCWRQETTIQTLTTHGEGSRGRTTPEYRAYCGAKKRCTNTNELCYANYGGRGIEFRFTSYDEFLAHVGRRPTKNHSLDRYPNNNGHYEKGNVRWATNKEQSANKRTNRQITYKGQTLILSQWINLLNIPRSRVEDRLYRFGWCETCALSLPVRGSCKHRRS